MYACSQRVYQTKPCFANCVNDRLVFLPHSACHSKHLGAYVGVFKNTSLVNIAKLIHTCMLRKNAFFGTFTHTLVCVRARLARVENGWECVSECVFKYRHVFVCVCFCICVCVCVCARVCV